MIREIDLLGIPCFEGGATALNGVPKVALFYGPNGAGKSSLARQVENSNHEFETAHFSEEYITRLLGTADNIPGVFTIRDAPAEVQLRLDELAHPTAGLIPKAHEAMNGHTAKQHELESYIDDELAKLRDKIWDEYKSVVSGNTDFSELYKFAFTPKPGSRRKFLETCRRLYDEGPTYRSLEAIENDFESLEQQKYELLDPVPSLPDFRRFSDDELALMSSKLTSSSESSLKSVFDQLGNTEWVLKGLQYIDHSDASCPFCRQELSIQTIDSLEKLLDHSYINALDTLEKMAAYAESAVVSLRDYAAVLAEHPGANTELISQTSKLVNAWQGTLESLKLKIKGPEDVLEISNHDEIAEFVQVEIDAANAIVQEKVKLALNKHETEGRLRNEIWSVFVMEDVVSLFVQYDASIKKPKEEIRSALDGIRKAEESLSEWQPEYDELYLQISDSAETVEQINSMLEGLGFYSFFLQPQEKQDSYRLARADGTDAAATLSEGEKTFIAFLYFYASTMQKARAIQNAKALIAIIDDPVSSLDSDTLFLIAILTRNLIEMCDYRKNPSGDSDTPSRLKQIFLLTHNAYFHKEVTNRIREGRKWDLGYFMLRKGVKGPTTIEPFERNPIESMYAGLWREIREGLSNGQEVTPSIQNSMRRIIENYFHSQGGLDLSYLRQELTSAEYSVCRSLVSWLHDGSHNIPWDPDFAPTQYDQTIYYEAFRKIFVGSEQEAHYNFMMEIESTEESAL